jgi:nicotinamidase-related amidase
MQNDFINGPIAIKECTAKQDPLDSIPKINKLVDDVNFDLVVYTQDWHPKNHVSFYENYIINSDNKIKVNFQVKTPKLF